MAPRQQQHTFTTVPNPLGMQGLMARPTDGPQSKPPMTSKQAQKLYREATRGPRLSRAEQRRVEREEQDRIRRELDRDRQTTRARALRDRQRDKDRRARDDRKRKGLPLVEPRASQGTISRFLRGNGAGRKRDAVGEAVGVAVGLPPVREEVEVEVAGDSRSSTEDGVGGGNTLAGEAAGIISEGKRRRLGDGLEEGNDDTEKTTEIKGVEVKGVGIPAKGVERPGGEDLTANGPQPTPSGPGPAPLGKRADKGVTRGEGKGDLMSEKGNPLETPRSKEPKGPRTETTPGRKTSPEDTKPCPASNSTGNTAHTENAKTTGDVVTMKALAKPPVSRPSRLGTPDQPTSGREKGMLGTTPDPAPKKTPLNKPAQTPNPQSHTARPPQQQRPPKPAPVQPPPTRKVLQETTNTPNRIRPPPGSDSASKFALPSKPSRATQRQSPAAVPAFKQPRPRTPGIGGHKPQFLPPHVRNSTTSSRSTTPSPPAKDDFYSAPPTSTQLFIMSHIDDLCPSPTQEARELRGDPPTAVQPVKPAPRQQPQIPSFKGDRPRQPTRQVARVQTTMPPPPRPTVPAEPARGRPVKVEPTTATKPCDVPAIPFISTQDLLFSSQDLRDVEEPTTTPSRTGGTKTSNKPPPFQRRSAAVQRPSPLSDYSPRAPAQPHTTPRSRTKPATVGAKQLLAPVSADRSSGAVCGKKGDCLEPKYLFAKKQSRQESRSGTPQCPAILEAKDAAPADAQRRPPPREKPRFFGSSDELAVALALDRSKKTHDEEERRRHGGRGLPQNAGREGMVNPTDTASQETDYGDPELDSIDFEDLVTAMS
ncbi:uncharacterized protein B0H64DRAFT_432999 [Chaetomium fimeti]|uniref:Uncharacterized protein n=1 Tax=Chaetomium fimeti TaxID=1854472 RepID=A0AAE0LT18_9PEZI|nr:hypothetical protein B0H64DRAFT_432999 [Chaetomium fimeti]